VAGKRDLTPLQAFNFIDNTTIKKDLIVMYDGDPELDAQFINQKIMYCFEKYKNKSPSTDQFKIDEIRQDSLTISFNQSGLIEVVERQPDLYSTLNRINLRENGLCEIICNFVLMNDLMGKNESNLQDDHFDLESFGHIRMLPDKKFASLARPEALGNIYKKISADQLNKPDVKYSHILDNTSVFKKLLAFAFNVFPFNILNRSDQRSIMSKSKKVNKDTLSRNLDSLETGTYLKFEIFQKEGLRFTGHSCLIKKIGDNKYSFFDSNHGESSNLNIDQLIVKMEKSILEMRGTNIALLDAKQFLAKQNKFIPESEKKQESSINNNNLKPTKF
jgi:hypothetical protein